MARTVIDKDKENVILLSLNREIALIRDKDDLRTIIRHLKTLFPFSNADIGIIDKDSGDQRMLFYEAPDLFPFHDGVFDVTLAAGRPLLFDLDTLLGWEHAPEYLRAAHEAGVREFITVALHSGREKIGVFYLLAEKKGAFTPHDLNLLEDIAPQLSTVVANILIQDELRKKDQEKAILLAISRDMTMVRTKEDLYHVIDRHIGSFAITADLLIGHVHEDKKTCSAYLYRPASGHRHHEHPDFPHHDGKRYPLEHDLIPTMEKTDSYTIADLDEYIQRPGVSAIVRFWHGRGIKEIIAFPLIAANELVGALWLMLPRKGTLTHFHLDLFKGFCSQIAVALVNIKANDQIAEQLKEIGLYKQQLEAENSYLLQEIGGQQDFKELLGEAPAIREVFHLIKRVADSRSTVLILGETGTGKELIARAIHNGSGRADKLLVKVNCATLPAPLIESELFGHEKGSFTGATERKLGKFELANNGTLFLDEIGELPPDLQVKLLRVLQEREIERIGGRGSFPVDVRIVAATNRNIEKEVAEGRFRTDLYYRLNVFPIVVPPLRERKTDIPLLVAYFIERYAKNAGKRITGISDKAQSAMMAYDWPGNVRELEHLIERSILLAHGPILKDILLPMDAAGASPSTGRRQDHFKTLRENEREHIVNALKKTNGKISGPGGAAELLDINVSTLNARIRKLGIKKDRTYHRPG
jgi:formate hydrogenlyase transcriptional activator